jgi:ankyrin repeat protein
VTATHGAVAAPETILDIVRELLLLEGQSDIPNATGLPDKSICHLISVFELEHETALRAIDEVAYDDAVSFTHGVCASALTPLSCHTLLKDMAPGEGDKPGLPLLHHLMVNGNIHVAREYLDKLDESDMPKTDLISLLSRTDGSGPSALESAITMGCADNIKGFIGFVAGLRKLGADEKLGLLEAKRRDGTPGLVGALKSGGAQMQKGVYAYMTGLLQFDTRHIREVIGMLSAPDKDGNSPFRLALMKDDAGLVFGMVRAICEDQTLAPDEKAALLFGQLLDADANVDYKEKALTAYYLAVEAKYLEKNPSKGIPKNKEAHNGKITYFTLASSPFEKHFSSGEPEAKLKWDKERDASLSAMMSQLTEKEREELKQLGRRLVRQEQEKAAPAFHTALRNGKAQSVTGYISSTIQYAVHGSHIRPISLILAEDASGNPALFNAMENDEFRAVGAYVDAVLSSELLIEDKYALLKPFGIDGYTPLQVAMASGNHRAMSAYVACVLASSLNDYEKQHLLTSVGRNGKSARQTLVDLLQKKPDMDKKALQQFDAMINESNLGSPIKGFLTHAYGDGANVKKT